MKFSESIFDESLLIICYTFYEESALFIIIEKGVDYN